MLVIVQGVFRSGTTALFETLRQDRRFRCYLEPLHPRLISHIDDMLSPSPKDPAAQSFADYGDYRDRIAALVRPDFSREKCILEETDNAPELETYLRFLADTHDNVVLQFNRAFWCTQWLHRIFPDSYFIHIVRDPRAVVWSQMTTTPWRRRVLLNLPVLGARPTSKMKYVFSRFAGWGDYRAPEYFDRGLGGLAREDRALLMNLRKQRPFVRALAVWGLQARICHQQAQSVFGEHYHLLRYEDFCVNAARTVKALYCFINLELPQEVTNHASANIHTKRLAPWREIPRAHANFGKGMQRAGVTEFAKSLGYV